MLKPRAIGRQVFPIRNSVARRTYIGPARSSFSPPICSNSPKNVRAATIFPSAQSSLIPNSRSYSSAKDEAQTNLKKTPLYDLHLQNGGNLVPFGGHAMPVEYKDLSIVKSALWTREKASIFDVSHMYDITACSNTIEEV